MPDFGTPVADKINPNAGWDTLSNIMGMQSKQLGIQQQQQNLQRGAAETQMTQQSAQQRAALANVDWSKYAGDNGVISTDKMLDDQSLRQAAGDQFLDVMKSAAGVRTQQLNNISALASVNGQLRGQFAGILGALRTDPDVVAGKPEGIQKAHDELNRFEQIGGPDATRIAEIYRPMLEKTSSNDLAQRISNLQLGVMEAGRQASAQSPQYADTGAQLTNVNPQAAGGNLGPTSNLNKGVSPQITTDALGNLHVVGGGAGIPGTASFAMKLPNGETFNGSAEQAAARMKQLGDAGDYSSAGELHQALLAAERDQLGANSNANNGEIIPKGGAWANAATAQQAKDAQTRWSTAQSRDVDPTSGYGATSGTYRELFDLLNKNPNIGPGSAGWNQFVGRLGTLGGALSNGKEKLDPNADYQTVVGFLDRLSSQNASSTGATTNFGRQQAENATGNPEVMGGKALYNKLIFGSSINEAQHAYTQASQAYAQRHGDAAYQNSSLFEKAWSANASQDAFRLIADMQRGDKPGAGQDFDSTISRLDKDGNKSKVLQQYRNMKMLMQGRIPSDMNDGR